MADMPSKRTIANSIQAEANIEKANLIQGGPVGRYWTGASFEIAASSRSLVSKKIDAKASTTAL